MDVAAQMARHLRDVHFGGNWTTSNLRDQLADVSWEQATTKVYTFNTIAALAYHINYYISAVLKVLQGGPLEAKDAYSFDHPPILSQEDWDRFLNKVWADAITFSDLTAQIPEDRLDAPFTDEKYGTYYRNIQGIIEHTHYHLGQIALVKKLLLLPGPVTDQQQ